MKWFNRMLVAACMLLAISETVARCMSRSDALGRISQRNAEFIDQAATLQAPLVDWFECSDLGGDEPRVLWHDTVLEVSPERDQ